MIEISRTLVLEELDLRDCTANSDRVRTTISIYSPNRDDWVRWIVCGELEVREYKSICGLTQWWVGGWCRDGVTDVEHSAAWVFRFPVTGLQVNPNIHHGTVSMTCVIFDDPRRPTIRVPRTSPYDLETLVNSRGERSKWCRRCKPRHLMVPEEFYGGPPTSESFAKSLNGGALLITVGPTKKTAKQRTHFSDPEEKEGC